MAGVSVQEPIHWPCVACPGGCTGCAEWAEVRVRLMSQLLEEAIRAYHRCPSYSPDALVPVEIKEIEHNLGVAEVG